MTAVFAKQDRWDRVLFYAQKAHEIDNKNAKAKFRLGQAYIRTDKFAEAKVLLEEVLAENPDDALVKQELNKVNTANKAIEAKEKMIYKAMMTKFFPEQT
ncbi:hypothetical protein BDB01DRAFT_717944 [Pilobolus umbonatus]|nr:hypothetical protein BDB01DRAFT_717944 [Pilobolus umbonatus]